MSQLNLATDSHPKPFDDTSFSSSPQKISSIVSHIHDNELREYLKYFDPTITLDEAMNSQVQNTQKTGFDFFLSAYDAIIKTGMRT